MAYIYFFLSMLLFQKNYKKIIFKIVQLETKNNLIDQRHKAAQNEIS